MSAVTFHEKSVDPAGDGGADALERVLGGFASATAALEQWCTVRGFAPDPVITATVIAGPVLLPPADLRAQLDVGPDEPLGYRHVQLSCGTRVLSVAQNWFVRARLTPAMNQTLDTTDTPFGKVVAALGFTRETLAARQGSSAGCPPGTVLSQSAVLRLPSGQPLAYLIECYAASAIE